MAGSIDRNFIHYGIRTQDLELICKLAEENGIDAEWLKEEIFKEFHGKKADNVDLDDRAVESVINKALNKIKS